MPSGELARLYDAHAAALFAFLLNLTRDEFDTRDALQDVFCRLADAGTGILLIEQNFGLVRRVADRYYVLAKGSIVEEGRLAGLSMESLKRHVAV